MLALLLQREDEAFIYTMTCKHTDERRIKGQTLRNRFSGLSSLMCSLITHLSLFLSVFLSFHLIINLFYVHVGGSVCTRMCVCLFVT